MPLKYWRTMACGLALGIGGLAVWADDSLRKSPAKKESASSTAAAPAPQVGAAELPVPAPPSTEIEVPVRVLDLTAPPIVPPIHDPAIEKAAATKADVKTSEAPPSPPIDLPPPPPVIPTKPTVTFTLPTPPTPPTAPPSKPVASTPVVPPPAPTPTWSEPTRPLPPVASPTNKSTTPYKLYLRMGGTGQTRFEIRDGDLLLLKVYCEKIDLHGQDSGSSLPGLTASGKVRLHGSGLDGTCDQLQVVSERGEVMLKGNVRMTCYRGTTSSQVASETMTFQLGRATEATRVRATTTTGVVPASLR